ncbi:mobilome CxxCx(11)CxxC protein [Aeromonas veronii]|uniref:mobilome CxxCx(11)CxxC protein n=1 Tax=Aeromonas veronii TaxID=654 RepID=UPI0035B883C5
MNESEIKEKAKDYEFYCYGTARIFEKRASNLKLLRTIITFLGLITPIMAGSIFLSFGSHERLTQFLMVIAGITAAIQLALSTWSIVARWDESYEYAVESLRNNTELYNSFKSLPEEKDYSRLFERYQKLRTLYEVREQKDLGQNIKDKEKRFATFESLKYYKQKCQLCGCIPISIKPGKCTACGNF